MVLKYTVECLLDWSAADFWKVRSHPDFLNHLVTSRALRRVDFSPIERDADGGCRRVLTYVPRDVNVPEMAVAVVGDGVFELQDEQQWAEEEEEMRALRFRVTTGMPVLKDVVKTSGRMSLRDVVAGEDGAGQDEDRCAHVLDVEVSVSLFMVGGYLENAIRQNMETFYQQYPAVVSSFKHTVIREVYPELYPDECPPTPPTTAPQAALAKRKPASKTDVTAVTSESSTDNESEPSTDSESVRAVPAIPDGLSFSEVLDQYLAKREGPAAAELERRASLREAVEVEEAARAAEFASHMESSSILTGDDDL